MDARDTLLIVDDQEINRAILFTLFGNKYNLLEAKNGEEALGILDQNQENIAAILLDLIMPGIDGYQVMEEMGRRNLLARIPVIVITADTTAESEVRALDMGASDMVTKPFEPHVVERRVQNIVELNRHKLHLEELVEEKSASLRKSNTMMIDVLSNVIEYRSLESGQHIRRIRLFTKILLEEVARQCPEYELDERTIGIIVEASSMHDIGKIAIPDAVLNKPGRLTPEEFSIMQSHTVKGCEIMAGLAKMDEKEYLQYAYNICRYHHERWDGAGYPEGLKGDNIPICAQVAGIADCYDALTTDRVYKKAFSPNKAFRMIMNGECGAFSPKLLGCFSCVREQFATLCRQYADGRPIKPDYEVNEIAESRISQDILESMEERKAKYATLLRYIDASTMELDVSTGKCHLVYMADLVFEPFAKNHDFKTAVCKFVEEAVHPEDKGEVLEILGRYMNDFLENGMMKRSRKYRIYDMAERGYRWYMATVLRVDMENPRQKKVLIIWRRMRKGDSEQSGRIEGNQCSARGKLADSLLNDIQECVNDKWLTLVRLDKKFMELLGYAEEEVKEVFHDHFIEMIHPEDREKVLWQLREQMKLGQRMELEYRVTAKGGRILWLLDKCQMFVDSDGKEYICSMHIDITWAHHAQENLQETKEQYQIVLQQTRDMVFVWNIVQDELHFYGNGEKEETHARVIRRASRYGNRMEHVWPEDIPKLKRAVGDILSGSPYKELELRFLDGKGVYELHKLRLTCRSDEKGKPHKVIGVMVKREEDGDGMAELLGNVFQELYEAGNLRSAINSVLGQVGRKFDVSRVFIFENSADSKRCSITYEWCNAGVESEMDLLQEVPYAQLCANRGNIRESFDEHGVFCCTDVTGLPGRIRRILGAQGVCSLLVCEIVDKGSVLGYVGFDECRVKRKWAGSQIITLRLLSQLLSVFLMKQWAQEEALKRK